MTFYLYGTYIEGQETLPNGPFSFVVDQYREVSNPSFLIWFLRDSDTEMLLFRIRKVTRPADLGMTLHVSDMRRIRLIGRGILQSVYPMKEFGITAEEEARDMVMYRDLRSIPDEKTLLVKNAILKSNPEILAEGYFDATSRTSSSEFAVAVQDAVSTGLRIFGKMPVLTPLREDQILDFDVNHLFSDLDAVGSMPDGRRFFHHRGRYLYVHKVDRTRLEHCLGVDLIYNFLDEKRLVFVQYKCERVGNKFYPSSDRSHSAEMARMAGIPGLSNCYNLSPCHLEEVRLCRCPVFVKLCKTRGLGVTSNSNWKLLPNLHMDATREFEKSNFAH